MAKRLIVIKAGTLLRLKTKYSIPSLKKKSTKFFIIKPGEQFIALDDIVTFKGFHQVMVKTMSSRILTSVGIVTLCYNLALGELKYLKCSMEN